MRETDEMMTEITAKLAFLYQYLLSQFFEVNSFVFSAVHGFKQKHMKRGIHLLSCVLPDYYQCRYSAALQQLDYQGKQLMTVTTDRDSFKEEVELLRAELAKALAG